MEEWRAVLGYEGLYEVSSFGRIRGIRRKGSHGLPLKLFRNKRHAYLQAVLSRGGIERNVKPHILVCEAWHGHRPVGMLVRHLDGDSFNNSPDNLCWGTPRENSLDVVRHGNHHQSNKTHCKKGHPFDEENTGYAFNNQRGRNRRYCRACDRARRVVLV